MLHDVIGGWGGGLLYDANRGGGGSGTASRCYEWRGRLHDVIWGRGGGRDCFMMLYGGGGGGRDCFMMLWGQGLFHDALGDRDCFMMLCGESTAS